MTRPYRRLEQLADAYEWLRHPVWAWLHVDGEDQGGWPAPPANKTRKPRKVQTKPPGTRAAIRAAEAAAQAAGPSRNGDDPGKGGDPKAAAEPDAPAPALTFAEVEARAYHAFLDPGVRLRLVQRHVPPPDPPGSGTRASLLAHLETARLGALRSGNWREVRAAAMDMAKQGAAPAAGEADWEVLVDDRPLDARVEDALARLGAWRARRDAITAAVRADRDADRRDRADTAALPSLPAATPLP